MKVTCPQCSTENSIDADGAATGSSVVCERCAASDEALLVDDEMLTCMLLDDETVAPSVLSTLSVEPLPLAVSATPDDVLTIPAAESGAFHAGDQALVLEDVFRMHSFPTAPAEAFSSAETPWAEGIEFEDAWKQFSSATGMAGLEALPSHASTRDEFETKASQPQHPAAVNNAPVNPDNYAVGVRLLRIAPAWLLLGGISFISIIVLCSWIRPVGTSETFAANPVRQNEAINLAPAPASSLPAKSILPEAPVAASEPVAEAKASKEVKAAEDSTSSAELKPTQAATAKRSEEPAGESGNFTLQVSSHSEMSQANGQVSTLRAAGFEAHVTQVEIAKRGTWYRVQSGRFQTREEASRYASQLRDKGAAASAIITEVGK
ncbi:MAG: SPOR domain-containing protein [Acidobacteria bacterium]|nr:SPOR domain-containing protein [Acidobacteriota bacterium]